MLTIQFLQLIDLNISHHFFLTANAIVTIRTPK